MKHEPYDSLDLALAALPLEEPPAGLRQAILARTALRESAPSWSWDIAVVGACLAMIIWGCLALLTGTAAPIIADVTSLSSVILSSLTNVMTLAWLASGLVLAFCLSVGFAPLAPQRMTRRR